MDVKSWNKLKVMLGEKLKQAPPTVKIIYYRMQDKALTEFTVEDWQFKFSFDYLATEVAPEHPMPIRMEAARIFQDWYDVESEVENDSPQYE
jgi:hypothetical protein